MDRDELVERVAEAIYNERNRGLKNCWAWQDSGLDEEHPGTRDAIVRLARAALAIIEPAVREECAKVADVHANMHADYSAKATTQDERFRAFSKEIAAGRVAGAIRAGAKP